MYHTLMRKQVEKVENALKEHGIEFETSGDDTTFSIAPTATILTPNCSIELHKKSIAVNEQPSTIDEFIYEVLAVESATA